MDLSLRYIVRMRYGSLSNKFSVINDVLGRAKTDDVEGFYRTAGGSISLRSVLMTSFSVTRDAQGQITQFIGTEHDGVIHSFTVGKKFSTNASGFHFILTQVDFFENGQNYLGLTTVNSPDAGKWRFQATSGTSQFGYVASLSPKQGQGTIVTTAGSKGILDMTNTPLFSPKTTVSFTLPPTIQQALKNTIYFRPLFELESVRSRANAEAALKSVNLDINMPSNVVMNDIWGKGIPLGDKIWWSLAGIVVFIVIGGVAGSIAAQGLELGEITAFEASAETWIGGGLAAIGGWLWEKIIDLLPDDVPVPHGDDTPPPDVGVFEDWSDVPDAGGEPPPDPPPPPPPDPPPPPPPVL